MSIDLSKAKAISDQYGAWKQLADASGRVLWSANSWPDDLDTGLEFASADAFSISVASPAWNGTMEYCNGSGWKTWDGSKISSGKAENGQCIYVRGTGNNVVSVSEDGKWTLTGTDIECNGNIEKLLDYAIVATGQHPSMQDNCYNCMFYECPNLTTAPSLPATTLAYRCYFCMFGYCTNLTTAPSLPATTLAEGCYWFMFGGSGLTTAPSLPATTLAEKCYYQMFCECENLTTAPSLPATTLAVNCYGGMFQSCTNLTTAPSLPATTLAANCYGSMFRYCSNLTSVPKLPATNLLKHCYYLMFNGCSKIKLSETATGTYTKAYRIPYSGTGSESGTGPTSGMFNTTGGTFKGTPSINKTYYLDSSNTIV